LIAVVSGETPLPNTAQKLFQAEHIQLLTGICRGIEKESLRITDQGTLAQTPHPSGLGSALTHPSITTDYSEALLELITPVSSNIDETLQQLDDIHRYVYSQLDNESLWPASMPCVLNRDEGIPIAQYGSSNVGTMKSVYRLGLGHRYGRAMQTIAGIHYNFSLPEQLWPRWQQLSGEQGDLQDFITERYFAQIRNFNRFSWLLIYLFGASPAVCKTFVGDQPHQLQALHQGTLYLPYATALRMGDLGYQSNAQQGLDICYNSLDSYLQTLKFAITEPHPQYQQIGIKNDGEYRQLSTALLQIENEFYSPIRPKRVARSGETALTALKHGGVEYIEVRCIDVNPYLPLGIDAQQIRFLDCFLLHCLLADSPACDVDDRQRIAGNMRRVVNEGRRPGLQLQRRDGNIGLQQWGEHLLDHIQGIAELMDQAHGGNDYVSACQAQRDKIRDPELTPSAQILAELADGQSFYALAMGQSTLHQRHFSQPPLTSDKVASMQQLSEQSLQQQRAIEAADDIDFDRFLQDYFRQYDSI
jgi:glutamate--cysteine ligase